MRTILILLDTLNRHALSAYGGTEVETPNIDRLAERSVVFKQHWAGSLPCMPARRDLFTGRTSFLEKGWGGIEPFDRTLPAALRETGVYSHIVTDHYHYFATGGENYCQPFTTWDFQRGQEDDPWASTVSAPPLPGAYYGQVRAQCERNRRRFAREADYPGPRTIQAACDWLERNRGETSFFLQVEAFDPHEPFDCPENYLARYGDSYDGPRYDWPAYGAVDVPPEALAHVRRRYAATLTMIDAWLGKLFDTMDRLRLWDDTLVIFTTDHGFLLGEHDLTGKNVMPVYRELAHLPLFVRLPDGAGAGRSVDALTQNIDLMPTILDYMGIPVPETVQGVSLRKLLEGSMEPIRDAAIYGYHGMAVNVTDGRYAYLRAPAAPDNHPCYTYTAMPTTFRSYLGRTAPERIETGRFLPYTAYPVFRMPETEPGVAYARNRFVLESRLYDLENDPAQERPLRDEAVEARMIALLTDAMREAGAPPEQYVRLGLPVHAP